MKKLNNIMVFGLVAAFLATGCATGTETKSPTQSNELAAPATNLVEDYLAAKMSFQLLEKYVKSGAFDKSGASFNLIIRGKKVDASNVDEYLDSFKQQVTVLEETIKQRGYANISGTYKGEATKSCAKSNSIFAAAIQEGLVTDIGIIQDGIDAQLTLGLEQKGKAMSIGTSAVIAENAMALVEPMNSDFYFVGEIRDRVIVLKPDLSVLDHWPSWAGPPSRSDLENCVVTLERI